MKRKTYYIVTTNKTKAIQMALVEAAREPRVSRLLPSERTFTSRKQAHLVIEKYYEYARIHKRRCRLFIFVVNVAAEVVM